MPSHALPRPPSRRAHIGKPARPAPARPRREIDAIVATLKRTVRAWAPTAVGAIAQDGGDPFRILISCLISLRTTDAVTGPAAERLFRLAQTPEAMARLVPRAIASAIYPASFYRTKGRTVREVCRTLLRDFGGRVPDSLEDLLRLKGVGRKTANLVVTLGYRRPGICVDTHVHRIANRLGLVRTKTPEATEFALRAILPRRHWIPLNDLLVAFGQNLCRPLSPFCSRCPIATLCPRVGVARSR
jgi:endonuclease-3